jgi:hypothetical protein
MKPADYLANSVWSLKKKPETTKARRHQEFLVLRALVVGRPAFAEGQAGGFLGSRLLPVP